MTNYEPRPDPKPPSQEPVPAIVIVLMLLLGCAVLIQWSRADARGRTAEVPGTIALVFVHPPEPLDCSTPGWLIRYVPSGIEYWAHSAAYHRSTLVLELTPAVDECVFVDSFEGSEQ